MFGLVSRKIFSEHVKALLGANGVNFGDIIAKTRNLGLSKAEEAKSKRQRAVKDQEVASANFVTAKTEAEVIFNKAVEAAQTELNRAQLAVDNQYHSASIAEAEAKKLIKSADYFSQ